MQRKTAPSKQTADPANRASKQDQKSTLRSTRFIPPTVTELAGVNNHWKGLRKHGDEVVADIGDNCGWKKVRQPPVRALLQRSEAVAVIEDEGISV